MSELESVEVVESQWTPPGFVRVEKRPWQLHYAPTPEHLAALDVWARNGRMARLRMLANRPGDREHWRRKMRYQSAEDKARRDAAKEGA